MTQKRPLKKRQLPTYNVDDVKCGNVMLSKINSFSHASQGFLFTYFLTNFHSPSSAGKGGAGDTILNIAPELTIMTYERNRVDPFFNKTIKLSH